MFVQISCLIKNATCAVNAKLMLSCCSKNTPCSLDIRACESSWFYFFFILKCKSSILECEGLVAPSSTSNSYSGVLCAILTVTLLI